METIRGRMSLDMDSTELHARLANYNRINLDLGTGDGKFAFCHAGSFPGHFVIGVDSCRENLACAGWQVGKAVTMDSLALRNFPSAWAKRLAFGRDPRAVQVSGRLNKKREVVPGMTS